MTHSNASGTPGGTHPRPRPITLALTAALLLAATLTRADEGMYPLSEIAKLNLAAHGIKVTAADIFDPGKVGIVDAIVRVGGCTGSFVSPEGLIITNHHCAFGIVQQASTPERDYITDGFLAVDRKAELPAAGLTIRITESYTDVSSEVLADLPDTLDYSTRAKTISRRTKEIVARAEADHPGKRAEVSEMFPGKSYLLFMYTYLRDVRAVYVPPRSVGEFGGETDNWVWPRHTGDFAFVRAYVAPDGSPAEYSPDNVPYTPKRYLRVDPAGVEDGDNVFILGYPGRTFRHQSSSYLAYEEDVRMPYVADLYRWEIGVMEALGGEDPAVAIKTAGRIKSLSNVMKNYTSKLQGMERLGLTAARRAEDSALTAFIGADPSLRTRYGNMLGELEGIYNTMRQDADLSLTLAYMNRSVVMLETALTLIDASHEMLKPDLERRSEFMERNIDATKASILRSLRDYVEPVDQMFLREFFLDASDLDENHRIAAIDDLIGDASIEGAIDEFISAAYGSTRLSDSAFVAACLGLPPDSLAAVDDPFLKLAAGLRPLYEAERARSLEQGGALTKLNGEYAEARKLFLKKDFIPDANGTLRMTFGSIKGYTPADALYAEPITTIRGVIEKTTGREPFNTPARIVELYGMKDYGRLASRKLKSLPVCLLYNLDTTGGNSGSPLLNASGDLVGVNFDRAYGATINDFAWDESYSRSIAVDIRYVLWMTAKVAGAERVIKELGVGPVD
jgi:hypothetical protein